jgi:uncharacterized protein (TIGR03437 family)
MDLVATTIGSGLSLAVSFPRTLLAQVVDNCGNGVSDATTTVSVAGLNILLQSLGNGLYTGTWTPEQASPAVAVSFTAVHPTLGTAQRTYTLATPTAAGGVVLAVMTPDGVVDAAGFSPLRPLAPGSIIAIFGSRFAAGTSSATAIPLARTLGGVSVRIGNEDAPLYFVGPGQINAQVPVGARVGESVSVVVNASGRITAPQNYLIAPTQPGIFMAGTTGVILDTQNRLITAANPARLNDALIIYSNGLGAMDPPAATGEASPAFTTAVNAVTVTIGGVEAQVDYQGLTPGLVGLNQINVRVPANAPLDDAVPVVVRQNGIPSNPLTVITVPLRSP